MEDKNSLKVESSAEVPQKMVLKSLFFLAGFIFAILAFVVLDQSDTTSAELHEGGYKYINPLLACELGDRISGHGLRNFRSVVQNYVDSRMSKERATHISIYYRDLNNGPWFGINETEK